MDSFAAFRQGGAYGINGEGEHEGKEQIRRGKLCQLANLCSQGPQAGRGGPRQRIPVKGLINALLGADIGLSDEEWKAGENA